MMLRACLVILFLMLHGPAVAADANSSLDAGIRAFSEQRLDAAAPQLEAGLAQAGKDINVSPEKLRQARTILAMIYLVKGRLDESRQLVDLVLPEATREGDTQVRMLGLQVSMMLQVSAAEDDKALATVSTIIELQNRYPDRYPANIRADNYAQQAFLQDKAGNTPAAIRSQDEAIAIYKTGLPDTREALLGAYTVQSSYTEKAGAMRATLEVLHAMQDLYEAEPKKYVYELQNLRKRITYLNASLQRPGPDVDHPYGNLDEELTRLTFQDPESMRRQIDSLVAEYGPDSPLVAMQTLNYANALTLQGKMDQAFSAFEQTRTLLVKLYGETSPNLGDLYMQLGNAHTQQHGIKIMMGDAAARADVLRDYSHAVKIYASVYGDAHPKTIAAMGALSGVMSSNYEERDANFILRQRLFRAYTGFEADIFPYLTRMEKLAFRQQYASLPQSFVEAGWLAGTPSTIDDAFSKVDWEKPESVAQYNTHLAAQEKQQQQILQQTFSTWLNYKGGINAVENSLAITRQTTTDNVIRQRIDELLDVRKQLANISADQQDWLQQKKSRELLRDRETRLFQQLSQAIPELLNDQAISIEMLAKQLPEKTVYLDFAKVYTYQYAVFVYDRTGNVELVRLGDDTITLEQRVKEVRGIVNDVIDGRRDFASSNALLQEKMAALYEKIIVPLRYLIKDYDQLIIAPDGLLALLPMGMLYDKEKQQYLVEQYAIRSVPSARSLLREPVDANVTLGKAAILADPDFNAGGEPGNWHCPGDAGSRAVALAVLRKFDQPCISRLPATAVEAESVAKYLSLPSQSYTRARASEATLRSLQRPAILHIATHGFFLPDPAITNPLEKAGLLLSGANTSIAQHGDDGIVTGLKIASMDLTGTSLVVLSACETGVGDVEQGEGVAGLNQAFLRAGAKGVIMSLWRVPDVQTAELMRRFYQAINDGQAPAAAMRTAQRSFIRDRQHPLAWAAFVYSG